MKNGREIFEQVAKRFIGLCYQEPSGEELYKLLDENVSFSLFSKEEEFLGRSVFQEKIKVNNFLLLPLSNYKIKKVKITENIESMHFFINGDGNKSLIFYIIVKKEEDSYLVTNVLLENNSTQQKIYKELRNTKVKLEKIRKDIGNTVLGGYCVFEFKNQHILPHFLTDKFAEIFGYSKEKLEQLFLKEDLSFFFDIDQRIFLTSIELAFKDMEIHYSIIRIIQKNGSILPVTLCIRKIEEDDDSTLFNILLLAETKFLLQHEQILNESERGIFVIDDVSKDFVFVNEIAKKDFAIESNLIGKDLSHTLNKNYLKLYENFLITNKNGKTEGHFISSSGSTYKIIYKKIDWFGRSSIIGYSNDLTEIERVQQKLSESYDTLETVIEGLGAYYWTYDVEKDIVKINNQSLISEDLHEIIYDFSKVYTKIDLIHPDDFHLVEKMFKEVKNESSSYTDIFRFKIRGKYYWTKNRIQSISRDGKIIAIGSTQNITDEIEIKNKYFESLNHFNYISGKYIVSGIFNLTKKRVERVFQDISGVSIKDSEIFTEHFLKNIPEGLEKDELKRVFKISNLIQAFKNDHNKVEIKSKYYLNGKLIWIRVSVSLLKNPSTSDVMAFVYLKDIDSKENFNNLVGNIVNKEFEYISWLNFDTNICNVIVNKSSKKVLNGVGKRTLSLDEYVENFINKILPERTTLKGYKEYIRTRLGKNSEYETYVDFNESPGKIVKLRLHVYKIKSDEEIILVSCSDISEIEKDNQKKAKALAETLELANSANAAKSTFLSAMSHDIRTPLNAIVGMTDLALLDCNNKEKVIESLNIVKDSSNHLLELINNILEMSRSESGSVKVNMEGLNIESIIDSLLKRLSSLFQAKNQEVKFIKKVEFPYFKGNIIQITRILENIINNSIKFTPKGGTIEISIVETFLNDVDKTIYNIQVKDNGIGISQEQLPHIFEPFYRSGNAAIGGIEGTGLGLSITKNLIASIGGSINVKSNLKIGTIFDITLPVTKYFNHERSEEVRTQEKISTLEGRRILVIEDNKINAKVASRLLEKAEAIVEIASNGKIGLDMFISSQINHFDVILMDLQMPVMDGYEASRKIRYCEHSQARSIPIIAMTANAFAEDAKRCLEVGMNEHLAKPLNLNLLIKTINRYC